MSDIRRKVVLVDDDKSCRDQGRAILKNSYEVFAVPSAYKLFELLEMVTPDLILLDIHMPIVDGFLTIKRVKKDPRFAGIPVIFLTATSDKESVVKGSSLGAAGFVTKPFSAADLISRINDCLTPGSKVGSAKGESAVGDVVVLYDESVGEGPAESAVTEKPVVLAIDDAPDVLKTIHAMLRDLYKVFTLPKPEKLQEFLHKTVPDVFLIDYHMPTVTGFEIIPIIRSFPEHEKTPIILLTSAGTFENISAAVALGACDFIVKPFEKPTLRRKVAKHSKYYDKFK
jgi:CheY-like chemotaxis protein